MPNINHSWLHMGAPREVMAEVIGALGSSPPDAAKEVMVGAGLLELERLLPLPADLAEDDRLTWMGDNWGTRGGAWEVMRRFVPDQAGATFYFVTAYTPPLLFLDHLAARWPSLGALLCDVSFDDMVGGIGRWENGKRVSYETVEGEFEEITRFFDERREQRFSVWMRAYWLDEPPPNLTPGAHS